MNTISKYLNGVDYDFFESIDGVYVVKEANRLRGYRYICSYNTGLKNKERIIRKLRRYGQSETSGDWAFHHIVEGKHFADINFTGRYEEAYENELPCYMIHKDRHTLYTSLFGIRETDIIYRDPFPGKCLDRSKLVAESAKDKKNYEYFLSIIRKYEELYLNAYRGDIVMQKISKNVFTEAKQILIKALGVKGI